MARRIIWSPHAVTQLERISDYIAADSPAYARVFVRKVVSIVKGILAFPSAGRIVPEYNNPNLREKIYGHYRIIYRMRPTVIEIVAICHGAQLLSNVFYPNDL